MEMKKDTLDTFSEELSEKTGLSPTRSKVLALIKLKKDKSEIAEYLDISPSTVQNHIQDIRNEIVNSEEILDITQNKKPHSDSLYEEFGGSLWIFKSGMRYVESDSITIEKKIYSSPKSGACLLVERKLVEAQGHSTENIKRTEFYDGNDIPQYLYREGKFNSYQVAALHSSFIANAGIDPTYAPSELVKDSVSIPDIPNEFQYQKQLFTTDSNGWIELVE